MKKTIVMLVMLFAVVLGTTAQTIHHFEDQGRTAVLTNGAWVDITQYPGWNHFSTKLTIQENISEYFRELSQRNPRKYALEYRAYAERGGVVMPSMGMVGGYGIGMGMGMVGYGYGMQNTGMVGGSMGMAGARSEVVIDNSNLAETVGSGITMSYDTGSNSLSVSGDPITAGLRLISAIGGKKKARAARQTTTSGGYANGQVLTDVNGNQYVVSNGQLVPVQRQATTATRSTTTTNATTYNNAGNGGFVSGF